jgi:hypothetical protein
MNQAESFEATMDWSEFVQALKSPKGMTSLTVENLIRSSYKSKYGFLSSSLCSAKFDDVGGK